MGLDSAIFLLFLGCVALLQPRFSEQGRIALLLCASLAFYAFADLSYLALILILCMVNYTLLVGLKNNPDARQRTWLFAGAVTANLLVLVTFKYTSGFLNAWTGGAGWFGTGGKVARWAVPLGLSYFTFQMLACITDAYRQSWQVEGGLPRFLLFGFFFPQITSGPIPRAPGLLPQLSGCPTAEDRMAGVRLICYGLFKKYVVANRLSLYVTDVFDAPHSHNFMPALLASCFNAMQLYADFSGYVDIALGSARFLGIRLDPNFDRPYVSTSVTEFWRRWHMSLSFWLRDYLYLPLVIRIRTLGKTGIALALLVTFAICGLWHGATWPFILFGVAQGVALTAEMLTKSWRSKKLKRAPKLLIVCAGGVYTLGFFVLSEILFRSVDLSHAWTVLHCLIHPHFSGGLNGLLGTGPYNFVFYLAAVVSWFAVAFIYRRTSDRLTPWFAALCGTLILLLGSLGSAHFIYAGF